MECIVKDLPIYYQEYGYGKPVLCLHGFSVDHRVMKGCLETVFEKLNGYRRIYLDLPGMGKTPSKPWIKNADDMLEIIKEFIRKIIGEESFLLVGQSYGGYLSIGILLDTNIKVDGIFLICPCVIADKTKRRLPAKDKIFAEDNISNANEDPADVEAFKDIAVIATSKTWQRYKTEVLPGLKIAETVFLKEYQKKGYSFTFEADFKKIVYNKAASIITGKQDDCVGYEDSLELSKNLPNATFSVIDDAGHNLQIEQEEQFNLHFRNWLIRTSSNR